MKTPLRIILLLAVASLPLRAAITVADDALTDGERVTQSLPDTLHWFTYSSGASIDATIAPGALTIYTGENTGVSLAAHFPGLTLTNVGDTITLTYQFQIAPDSSSSGGAYEPKDQFGVRAGLFNSNGTTLTADGTSGAGTQAQMTAVGWASMTNPRPAVTDAITLRRRDGANAALITGLTGVFANVTSGRVTTGTPQQLATATTYTGTFTIQLTGANTVTLTSDFTGGNYGTGHFYATVNDSLSSLSSAYRTFDTVAFGVGTSSGVSALGGFTLVSARVTFSNAGVAAPTIETQPAAQAIAAGGSGMLTVVPAGQGPYGYLWRKDGEALSGETNGSLTIDNMSAGKAGNYSVVVSNAGGSVTSADAAVTLATVIDPPVVTTPPASGAIGLGQPVTLTVAVSGTAPFTYAWKKDGTPIAGATNATYTIAAFQAADAGSYTVTVTNSSGSDTSAAAVLTLSATPVAPTILTDPAPGAGLAGSTVELTVDATGTEPLSYQWNKNGNPVPGATSATLSLANLQAADAGTYTVTVTNSAGSVTSAGATVTFVVPGVSITQDQLVYTQDFNHDYTTSTTAVSLPWADSDTLPGWYLTMYAAGTPANLTTQATLNGTSAGPIFLIASATEPENFALTARVTDANGGAPSVPGAGYYFALKLTNHTGATIRQFSLGYTGLQFYRSTGTANNTVRVAYKIAAAGTAPALTTGTWNAIDELSFTAPQNGSEGAASILNFNAGNFVDFSPVAVSGLSWADGEDLWVRWWIDNVTSTDQGVGIDNVVFAASSPIGPNITVQPASMAIVSGETLSLSVTADGPGTLTYQWSKNGEAIAGATSATLDLGTAQPASAGVYTVTVTNSNGAVTSSPASVAVIAPGRSITAAQLSYTEDFNHSYTTSETGVSLPWTDNSTLAGWFLWMKAAGTPTSVTTQASVNGTSAGPIFLIASATAPDNFALAARVTDANGASSGTAGSGYYLALKLTNNSGGTISSFSLGYTGLQFYRSTGVGNNTVSIAYQVTDATAATAITGGTWTEVPELSFTAPQNGVDGGAAAALNFNSSANSLTFAPVSVSGLTWRNGENLWIRWRIDNVSGTDQGVGIDNVTFTAAAPTGPAVPSLATAPLGAPVEAGGDVTLSVTPEGTGPFTYQWKKDNVAIAGATNAELTLGNFQAADAGDYTVTVTNEAGSITSAAAPLWLKTGTSRLANLSVRATAGTGEQILIAGFVVVDGTKSVFTQSPTLAPYGVSGALADPQLALYAGGTQIAANNDWDTAANADDVTAAVSRLGAMPLPAGGKDAALLADLQPGAYTAQVSGTAGGTGVALSAVFDADGPGRLSNVSGRCQTGTGDNIIIGGFVIDGTQPRQVLLRGVGPTLTTLGVTGALADPQLALYQNIDDQAVLLTTNDDWNADPAKGAAIATMSARLGAFALPSDSKDAALLLVLPPGVYTLQLSGVNNTTGVALIEIYDAQ